VLAMVLDNLLSCPGSGPQGRHDVWGMRGSGQESAHQDGRYALAPITTPSVHADRLDISPRQVTTCRLSSLSSNEGKK